MYRDNESPEIAKSAGLMTNGLWKVSEKEQRTLQFKMGTIAAVWTKVYT